VTEFASTFEEVDSSSLEAEFIEALEAGLSGWLPAEGDPLLWLAKVTSRIGATIFEQAATMEKGAFKRFGEAIVSVPPVQAAAASVGSTWTMIDGAGYLVPAGTQVSIAASGETQLGFVTVGDTVIAPEATKATIVLQAVIPGTEGNNLSEDPQLLDSLAFVEAISLEGAHTSGGVDEEEEDAYLNRLTEALQTLSDSLILPRDFEIDARSHPDIARAKCIRNYDADKEEGEVALCQSIYPITAEGEPPSEADREALLAAQQEKLLTDIQHHVGVPQYTEVDVESEIEVEEGFDPTTTIAAVQARLGEIFDPSKYGAPKQGDSGSGWENRPVVYYLKLVGEVEKVGGVGRVVTLKLCKGGGTPEAKDLTLVGVAPLTKPGSFTVTAS
jgi:hypothetical protein